MDKASGVYLSLTDNSIMTSGASQFIPLIPMCTTKGKLGLNTVTAETMEDVVGYDMSFNTKYYGLKRILENVAYAKVWRINQDASFANAYFENDNVKQSVENCKVVKSLGNLTIGLADAGNNGTYAVKFAPIPTISTVSNNNPTQTDVQVITIEANAGETGTIKDYNNQAITYPIKAGCVFYDASNVSIVGVIIDEHDVDPDHVAAGNYAAYRVIDGMADVSSKRGVVTITDDTFEITLEKKFSSDSFYTVHTIPKPIKDWTVTVGKEISTNSFEILKSINFSLNPDSEEYYKKIDFNENAGIDLFISDDWQNAFVDAVYREWITLENGSNGLDEKDIDAAEIDTSVLDNCGCNVILMNGLGAELSATNGIKIVNRIAARLDKLKIHQFVDAPAYTHYADLVEWTKKVAASKYVAIGARPDQDKYEGKTFYIYPSVNYGYIFAKMYDNYQNLNYPPAGITYGTVPASDLIDCDYELFADEMKTYRINWQRVQNNGVAMWEQRTTQTLETDLSYIAPVFIVDGICDRVVSFERNYNFRYITSGDLLNQESGIKAILDEYSVNNFIYEYKLKVPTYQEAQASGRTVNIQIEIRVAKDSEVINIGVTLNA